MYKQHVQLQCQQRQQQQLDFEMLAQRQNLHIYGDRRRRELDFKRDEEIDCAQQSGSSEAKSPSQKPDQKPKPTKPMLKPEAEKNLRAVSIDYHIKENCEAHRTDRFDCTEGDDPELVCRRGQSIKLTINFNRPYSKIEDDLSIILQIGNDPHISTGSKAVIPLDESGKKTFTSVEWGASLDGLKGNGVTVTLHIPCNCQVGEWRISIVTKSKMDKNKLPTIMQYEPKDDITILFNPWCKDDTVYMPPTKDGDDLLKEYVLNDSGIVYNGTATQIFENSWYYGQINDNQGVLMRKCDKGNGEHTNPLSWVGSVKILNQYRASKWQPVKYGQSWVVACVATTVCRALGIPTRTVTNFKSARDNDGSITIDTFLREEWDGSFLEDVSTTEKVWNFHVWNEVWMRRPDLQDDKDRFDGWQVIDATPPEKSNESFQCGPAPVYAVKEGLIHVPYDTGFVFSAVSGDMVTWLVLWDGTEQCISIDSDSIGKNISVMSPDGGRLDLTDDYKYHEGSLKERENAYKAWQRGTKANRPTYHVTSSSDDVIFTIHTEKAMIGQDLKVKVTAKNKGPEPRKIKNLKVTSTAVTYQGVKLEVLKEERMKDTTVESGKEHQLNMVITEEKYLPQVAEYRRILLELSASVEETSGANARPAIIFFKNETFVFDKPALEIQMPKTAVKGSQIKAKIKFNNPLKRPLTGCEICYEGSGIADKKMKIGDIAGHSTFSKELTLTTIKKGLSFTIFSLVTNELADIEGAARMTVAEK